MNWRAVAAIFVLAFLCAGVVSFVINDRGDRDDERAACVAAGGVPVWQRSAPMLCFDRDALIDAGVSR